VVNFLPNPVHPLGISQQSVRPGSFVLDRQGPLVPLAEMSVPF